MARNYININGVKSRPKFELTALIDVIFILLIFFAVSTSFNQNKKALELTLPSAIAVEVPKKSVTISVDRNQRVFWNAERVSEQAITSKLSNYLKDNSENAIILQADKNTPYVRVVSILDAIRLAGGVNIMLEAKKK